MSDEQMVEQTEAETVVEQAAERTFTQQELDKAVGERLARQQHQFERQIKGIDLDEARKLLDDKEKAVVDRQKEKGEFESILKNTVEKKDQEIMAYKSKLEQTLVDGSLLSAASKNNAVDATQVSQLLKGRVRLAEDGNVEVLDTEGLLRYNGQGSLLSVDELVSEFLTANPHHVRATQGGIGSQGNAGGTTQKPTSYADMVENWNSGGKEAFAATKINRK